MFRKMRRFNQGLSEEACVSILKAQPRGILAVHGEDGYPYALPLDYIYMDGRLYFHCAKEGHKLDAITADDRVSFCVMDEGFRKEGEWALNISSVIIFGRVRKIEDSAETIRIVRQLALKYYPTPEAAEEEVGKAAARVQILELTIDHMTGKLVNES
ncbi:MAG: pyridoxamine 5'-phosphate oxidase family protein [Butyrivibrio sp.]|jgi:nitroimidazol reductase NimA-like FMN-containing flavoprotein (pyridoxamine 5'-phosphate oxidase superfamily)|nr:pyridoxamine 5'-phosphate oxidase family protein [Butyrivibrio sp.]